MGAHRIAAIFELMNLTCFAHAVDASLETLNNFFAFFFLTSLATGNETIRAGRRWGKGGGGGGVVA